MTKENVCKQINQLVNEYTKYCNKEIRRYITLKELNNLLYYIKNTNEVTKYIRITPYYQNSRLRIDKEIEEYMFFVECREKVNKNDIKMRLENTIPKKYNELTEEEKIINDYIYKKINELNDEELRRAEILNPLIENNDVKGFKEALTRYWQYITEEQVDKLLDIVKDDICMKEEDFILGCLCFEVQSQ